jgi:steroid delta-isomerase-like uncharacterized protein
MYKLCIGVLILLGLFSLSSCGKKADASTEAGTKAVEGYRALNAGFASGDASVIDKYVDKDAVGHSPMNPTPTKGTEELKKFFNEFHGAFPDMKVEVHSTAVSGDTLFGLYHMTGTNSGPMMGMPATNKKVDMWGVDVIRFTAEGKLLEHWDFGDNYTFMKQLGLIPDMMQPAPSPTDSTKMMMEKK